MVVDGESAAIQHRSHRVDVRGGRTARSVKVIDIYARISEDYDGTTRSVDDQAEDLIDYIERHHDWTLGEVFKDHAKSGWNPKVVRRNWDQMMTRLRTGQSDGVVVLDLTRFTRKVREGEDLVDIVDKRPGVIVASLTGRYNLMTADGRATFRDKVKEAALESDKNSERARRGKRKKATKRGLSNASHRPFGNPGRAHPRPKGWQPGDPEPLMVPDELVQAEREAARDMARRLLAGETLEGLTREWNERGIRTNGRPAHAQAPVHRRAHRVQGAGRGDR